MKTARILLLAIMLLLSPWYTAQLFAQQENTKKIVITKRTVEADGTESTETIVKKGAAAESFDVDKYIRENRADNTQVVVKVSGGDEERNLVIKGSKSAPEKEDREADADIDDRQDLGDVIEDGFAQIGKIFSSGDEGPFLGVNADSDERANEPGVVVNIVRGAAADRAGLRDNDKIMKLNDTPVNAWSDLSKFVNAAKVGDKIQINYERNGKPGATEATLTSHNELQYNPKSEAKGYLGVSDMEARDEKDAPGVMVSIFDGSSAEKAGLRSGDVILQLDDTPISDFEDISDFMAYTKLGDQVAVTYERKGKRNTVKATLSQQKNTWDVNIRDWNLGNFGEEETLGNSGRNKGNCTVNVRAKDACIGVFSDAYTEGTLAGSRISDFTDESAAREANMAEGDVITAVNGAAIKSYDDLWNEIAKYPVGEKIKVEYLREGKSMNQTVTLKACRDNSSNVQILNGDGEQVRNFTSWNWNIADQTRLRERSIITIRKGEGDAPKLSESSNGQAISPERSLKLAEFRAYPNPTQGQMTVEFKGQSVPTTVSFFDLSGRQLFREELNAFNGRYSQQFDLAEYAKGTIVVHVQQGEKVFTEQMVVN